MKSCKPWIHAMVLSRRWLLLTLAACAGAAWGQSGPREPHIGYLYPAGGRRGASVQIRAGGQFLNGVKSVIISGEGVHASIAGYMRAYPQFLNKEQLQELRTRLDELRGKRTGGSTWADFSAPPLPRRARPRARRGDSPASGTQQKAGANKDYPLLRDLETMNPKELDYVAEELLTAPRFPNRKQANQQIAETVLLEISLDPDATPGDRELRLATPVGLTNPLCFQVGRLPEFSAPKRDTRETTGTLGAGVEAARWRGKGGRGKNRFLNAGNFAGVAKAPEAPLVSPPVLLNGRILPGEADRFRFPARRGQKLVLQAQARRLMPYLADAVPGWFQAALALYDATGAQVAFAENYRWDPDPVLFYEVPRDGEYQVEIRDALYRGREDFVYRLSVGELPFVTSLFPLGGQEGAPLVARITGWNLPSARVRLGAQPGGGAIRQAVVPRGDDVSNILTYGVDTLPESKEVEPNDTVEAAQGVALPLVIDGRIAKSGDVDVFRFEGRAGDKVVAEVWARRLGSPLDSLLRLSDQAGRVLAWNDDRDDPESGLLTHHADSYLSAALPRDGSYFVRLSDAQHHGGEEYGYRLRLSAPQPDFALRVIPSSINMRAGGSAAFNVRAIRKDGFEGDIELALKDAPAGLRLGGALIPTGRDKIRMTLSACGMPPDQPLVLRMEGRARIGGQTLSRPAVAAEDMMQAFAYRHLVPAQQLLLNVKGKSRVPLFELADGEPLRLPAGATAEVFVRTLPLAMLRNIHLELSEAPPGLSLQKVSPEPGGLVVTLKADGAAKPAAADNLIVEAFTEVPPKKPGNQPTKLAGAPAQQKQRFPLGFLPAIPFEIVPR